MMHRSLKGEKKNPQGMVQMAVRQKVFHSEIHHTVITGLDLGARAQRGVSRCLNTFTMRRLTHTVRATGVIYMSRPSD